MIASKDKTEKKRLLRATFRNITATLVSECRKDPQRLLNAQRRYWRSVADISTSRYVAGVDSAKEAT